MPTSSRAREKQEAGSSREIRSCVLRTPDARADGYCREAQITAASIRITRRVAGVSMIISVPTTCYRGVVLDLVKSPGKARYRLQLVHRDGDLNVPLFEAEEGLDVIAEWMTWSRFFGLPRLIRTSSGRLAAFDRQLGSIFVGDGSSERRSAKTIISRRPRFLARRKMGRRAGAGSPG